MAVVITTIIRPQDLLHSISANIRNGSIQTWEVVHINGVDCFTQADASQQWEHTAYFMPDIDTENNKLQFSIRQAGRSALPKAQYSLYHGTFIQMLLDHFQDEFTWASASS